MLADGRVLLVGGASGYPGGSDIYDPRSDTWQSGPGPLNIDNFPSFQSTTATPLPNGRVLITGQDSQTGAILTELYDPVMNQMVPVPPSLFNDNAGTATSLPDGSVLVAGGGNGTDSEIYDPVANSWSSAGPLVGFRYSHLAVLLTDGSVLLTGGIGNSTGGSASGFLRSVERSVSFSPVLSGPTLHPLALQPPTSSDALLTRGLEVTGVQGTDGSGIIRYDYGWAENSTSTQPDSPIYQTCDAGTPCRVNFRATRPDQEWTLFARAVDGLGRMSSWRSLLVHTPNKPLLIALGDSITSGHHRDSITSRTVCDDPTFGYPQTVSQRLRAALPPAWQRDGYENLAHSGFSTGEVEVGGINACSEISASPLKAAEALLSGNERRIQVNGQEVSIISWDWVTITGGIDNTNWGDVLRKVVIDALNPRFSASACAKDIASWDGTKDSTKLNIEAGEQHIIRGLRTANPAARIDWLSYYDVAKTGSARVTVHGWAIPLVCDPAMADATRSMRETLRAGLPVNVALFDANPVLGNEDRYLQPFFLGQELVKQLPGVPGNLSGWPHPNRAGAALLGSLFQP